MGDLGSRVEDREVEGVTLIAGPVEEVGVDEGDVPGVAAGRVASKTIPVVRLAGLLSTLGSAELLVIAGPTVACRSAISEVVAGIGAEVIAVGITSAPGSGPSASQAPTRLATVIAAAADNRNEALTFNSRNTFVCRATRVPFPAGSDRFAQR